ncbi:MAG TPA: POTRA domain-containing protein [Candidatus Solibacter sp.]|nr:POTRA domain-containing protein [Candidatus Solibacter sp.]
MRRGVGVIILSFLCFTLTASAQPSQFSGRTIRSVQYLPPQVLHPDDLKLVEVLKPGEPLRSEDAAEAIDRLFATGAFEDISVDVQPTADGVDVRIVTEPVRFVSGYTINGGIAQPPNRGELTSSAQVQLGAAFHEADVSNGVDRIKELLRANGLYEASVTPEVQQDSPAEQVFITFNVKAGKRAKYEQPVIHGETGLSDAAILRATGWRVPLIHWWRHVTDSHTRKGVQGVLGKYQKDDRLTTRVELESLDYDAKRRRVKPTLNIQPGPKIDVKAVEAHVSKSVMKRYVPVYEERTVDNDLLVEGARNLRDYFQSRGYYDVDVTFRTQPVVDDHQTIEYVISLGTRFRLTSLTIAGNKYFDEEALRERMFMTPAGFLSRRGRYSEAFRKKDEENIGNLYRANGYHDVKIASVETRSVKEGTNQVAVTVNIEEGSQWLVEAVNVEGVPDESRRKVFEGRLASAVGQPFSEVNMAADRVTILTWYFSNGYPRADLRAAWVPGSAPNRARVTYAVTEGELYFIRDIITTGLKTTSPKAVRNRITMHPGDPVAAVHQRDIQRSFYDMGVFARVDTALENPGGETRHKYVLYNFEEANRYSLAIGFGAQLARFGTPSANSVANPGGSTGFSPQVSLNVSRLNFRGLGHTVTLQGVYSNLQKRGAISYLAPRFQSTDGRQLTLSLLWSNSLDVRTFASKRQEAAVQLQQRLSKATTILGRFAYRRVSVSNVVIPVLLVPQLVQPVRIGIFSVNLAQDKRNDATNPKRGIYNTADLSLATRVFGSQRSFGRILLRNATYHQVRRNLVFARQTQIGMITPFASPAGLGPQAVPLPERFFGGGADSLRAVPFNQAGPRDIGAPLIAGGPASAPSGFPLGGNALFFNNLELRFPFIGANIGGVIFHDMGNVYTSLSKISPRFNQRDLNDFNYTLHAVGFGIRYRTPVGPVRGDLAYSINPPSYLGFSGTPAQLLQCNPNLTNLPGFCTPSRQRISHFQFFFSIGQTF